MNLLRSRRCWAVASLFVGAPVSAEYLQAYLTATGDAVQLLLGLLVLGPLYGGAAVLIREIAVRTGRGWSGILLLAAAFGVSMTGLIDLSLFTEHRADAAEWEQLWAPTATHGISIYAGTVWVLGHVVLSIGVPLAMLDALAPSLRGRPLLRRSGLLAVTALWIVAAALIHSDSRSPGSVPTLGQACAVLALVVALALLAGTPLGASVRQSIGRRAWAPVHALGAGFFAALAIDLMPATWLGLIAVLVVTAVASVALRRIARSRAWGLPQVTGLAAGALVERTAVGFLAPLPPGVDAFAKNAQSLVLLLIVIAVVAAALRSAP